MTSMTRRTFGGGLIALAGGAGLSACTGEPEAPDVDQNVGRDQEEVVSERGFIDPPYFADKVAAGKLPPIDERLPEEPFVVGPDVLISAEFMEWTNGRHGGTLRNSPTFPTGDMNIGCGSTILRSPGQTTEASAPNVVSEFSFSEDRRVFRFTIRPGLRWSDGTKVSTEDVRFTIEDLYSDPKTNRPWPSWLYTRGDPHLDPAKLKVVDEQVFELEFSRPYGYFVADLNSWIPTHAILFKPSHYLKQFHPKYADKKELAERLRENKLKNWAELLTAKDLSPWDSGEASALGQPVLNAWVLAEVKEQQRVFERNPYYWHVDSDGRQLPYADRVINNVVVDSDALTAAVMDSQVTVAAGDAITLNNMPVFTQAAERSKLRIFTTGSFNYPPLLFLNHDYQHDKADSAWQRLVADPAQRFGRAVAAAMDPAEINESVYFGLHGEPLPDQDPHDPELAKQLLDELGMTPDDAGLRLDPAGKPFTFQITFPTIAPDFTPVAELIRERLQAVGLRTTVRGVESTLFGQRIESGELMATIHWNDGPAWASGISQDYMPQEKGGWSPLTWAYLSSNGAEGRKPPPYLQDFYDLHTARKEHPPESEEGKRLFAELLKWFATYYVFIPTTGLRVKPNIVQPGVRNVPNDGAPFELDTVINLEGVWLAEGR